MSSGLRELAWRPRPAAAAPGAARPGRAASGGQPPCRDRPARATERQRGLGARQQLGSRHVETALREPLRVSIVGQPEVHKLVALRQHSGAGGECGRDDEIVVPDLDAPRHCGGDPQADLENELVDAKPVCHEVLDVRAAYLVLVQAVARRVGSGMLVTRYGRRHRAGRAQLTTATTASRCP